MRASDEEGGCAPVPLSLVIDVLLHRLTVLQMLRDDAVEQLGGDFSVPHVVRVHHDDGAARADEKAITACLSDGIHALVETAILELAGHQLKEGLRLAVDRAAR